MSGRLSNRKSLAQIGPYKRIMIQTTGVKLTIQWLGGKNQGIDIHDRQMLTGTDDLHKQRTIEKG